MKSRSLVKNGVNCILISLLFVSSGFAQDYLTGRVYEGSTGTEPPTATALNEVTLYLYGSNNSGQLELLIDSTQTDSGGWYSLTAPVGYEYYSIVEIDPSGYCSAGATSVGGTKINNNQIQYDVSVPLSDQTLTGNKFWDVPEGPEMDVKGNSTSINDGDGSPSVADDTDFGSVSVSGGGADHIFTIENSGNADLNLSGSPKVVVGGTHAGDFSVTVQPATPVSSAGGTTTFTVRFDPGASGTRTATISIANNDSNEDPYNFSVQGTGTIPPAPEIDIRGNGISITNGDATPDTADWTDMGSLEINTGSITKTFNIHNTGTATLNITGIGLSQDVHNQGGSVAAIWGIIPDTMIVAPGSSTTLGVVFYPYQAGTFATTLIIDNDDSDENPYQFSVQGTGTEEETGTIIVEKLTSVSTTELFTFTGDASGSIGDSGQIVVSGLQPGTYTSTESALSGWTITSITLDDANSTADPQTGTVTFQLESGETVKAVFTNRKNEVSEYDFGDAPDPTYPTLLASNGARHLIDPDVYLGALVDPEDDGLPDSGAQGDDNDTGDDEDGVIFTAPLTAGSVASLSVTASTTGLLFGWIDFDQNGTWDTATESVFSGQLLTAGLNVLGISVPADATPGATYARFRFTKSTIVDPEGSAPDGEVEDYNVEIEEGSCDSLDFGDAPSPYPDASHTIGDVWLGDKTDQPDADTGTQADPNALGDDNDGNDDEDGFTVLNGGVLVKHATNWSSIRQDFTMDPSVEQDLTIAMWVDYNQDGDWNDTDEFWGSSCIGVHIPHPQFTSGIISNRAVPTHAQTGTTFVRVRAYAAENPVLSPAGPGGIGEVCDFEVVIQEDGSTTSPDGGIVWGTKWNDADGNGQWDTGESPLSGWTIWLDTNQNGVEDAGDQYDTTDANGEFKFTSLPLGSYVVGEQLTAGWTQTYPTNPNTHTVVVDTNYCSRGVLFGNVHEDEAEYDFGDAPSPYPTIMSDNGAYHTIDTTFKMGVCVDAEADGQPDAGALGDDNNNVDDEEGLISAAGGTIFFDQSLLIAPGDDVKVGIWFDWERDGSWQNNGWDMTLSNGTQFDMTVGFGLLTFNLGLTPGSYNVRLRCYQDTSITASDTGYGGIGEVEDYQFEYAEQVVDYDYGDAPLPYPTQLQTGVSFCDGWRHPIDTDVYLGQSVDPETDGQPNADATGDDLDGSNDEDGVSFTSSLSAGQVATLQVTASMAGYLNGFIDWNQDDDWGDAEDRIFNEEPLTAGVNNLSFTVPSGVQAGDTYARFRFSTEHLYQSIQQANVFHAVDGEVEDYKLTIEDDEENPTDSTSESDLFSNYPNPFYLSTRISFVLPATAVVTLEIYNVQGEFVATLVNGLREAGLNQVTWDGKNSSGNDVVSGIYLCTMKTPGSERSIKMLLLR